MSPKYRFLLAILLTLIAICRETVFGQTKRVDIPFTVANEANCNCSITVTSSVTNSSLCNRNDGAIFISPADGSGDFTYKWLNQGGNTIGTSQNLVNVLPGTYYLEIADNNAPLCGSSTYGFTVSSALAVVTTVQDNDGCSTVNGAVSVDVTGGSGNYGYSWNLPDGTQTQVRNLTNVMAGTYQLTVNDLTLGCTVSKNVSVKSKSQLQVTLNSQQGNSSCTNADGIADVTVSGGSGQYKYYWYDLGSFGIVSSSEDLLNVKAGSYSLFVSDAVSGCTGYTYITIPELTAAPQFNFNNIVANTACSAPFNGAATLEISGTTGPYNVTWTDASNTIVSNVLNPTALAGGLYGITIEDTQTKCTTFVSPLDPEALYIEDNSQPTITVTVDALTPNTMCAPSNGSISVTVEDPLVPYTLAWRGPNNFSSTDEDIQGLASGKYLLTIEAVCNQPPVIELPPNTVTTSTLSINLLDIISDPNDNLDLNSFQVTQPPVSQAIASITSDHYLEIDYNNVEFFGTDNLRIQACDLLDACTESTFSFQIERNGGIVVFNAVAPHSTGNNKYMRILNLPAENKVMVFNRWGDLVFNTRNYNDETPGKRFEGVGLDGKSLPTGTYFYKIEFEGGISVMTGYLALKQ